MRSRHPGGNALLRTKQAAGKMERANDHLVAEKKFEILAANRREVNAVYKSRFASKEQADRMSGAPNGATSPSTRAGSSSESRASPHGDARSLPRSSPDSRSSPRSPDAVAVHI